MRRTTAPIFQLKIQLNDIAPPIWRRILVPGDINLGKLHEVIQQAMGWTDTHLHEFVINGESYSDPEAEIDDSQNESDYRLSDLAPPVGRGFLYLYDFGDGWEHTVIVEKTAEADKRYPGYPVCLDGARACPPEDCGGSFGYEDFLSAMTNPKHKRHKEMRDWIDIDFDAEHFDLAETNEILKESN